MKRQAIRSMALGACITCVVAVTAHAQADTTRRDTTSVQGAIFRRPFIGSAGSASVGGYMEANANYRAPGGEDGFSSEMRRFNIFLYAPVGPRLRFTSELEFEHGTEEISLETALLDFQISTGLVFRAGILLAPIGGFNQNHDGPRWEFVDRPLSATEIIPSTLSEMGFGANGRFLAGNTSFTYDAYLTNGLSDGVILNSTGRTRLAEGKSGGQFEGDNNGSPAFSTRVAVQNGKLGELGLSYYRAIYNTHTVDDAVVDDARKLSLAAVDASTQLWRGITLRGEAVVADIELPPSLTELQAGRQVGGFVDLVVPLFRPRLRTLRDALVSAAVRAEYVDLHAGTFAELNSRIYDETKALSLGLSFRPAAGTVFRVNYIRQHFRDLFGNATSKAGGFRMGVATYF